MLLLFRSVVSTFIFYFCLKKDMAEQSVRDLVRKLKVLSLPFFCIVRNTLIAEAVGCKLMLDHVKTVEM